MFDPVSILRLFVELPTLILVTALIGFALRRLGHRLGSAFIFAAMITLYATSTHAISISLIRILEQSGANRSELPAGILPSAIVILGAGMRTTSEGFPAEIGPLSLERLRQGARLHRKNNIPILLSGGPFRQGGVPLASVMAKVLEIDFGIKPRWLDTQSRTTLENAQFSTALLGTGNISAIYLVTHGWHMPRAKAAFEANGITVVASGTSFSAPLEKLSLADILPNATAFRRSQYAVHEWIGLLWYRSNKFQ